MTGISATTLELILKLRVVVGRFGEMDVAGWWNTRGQLGPLGASVPRRGFPQTHYFAQARSVFAVAAHRCREVYNRPAGVTFWQLPEAIEEAFGAHWERWLDEAPVWTEFFEAADRITKSKPLEHALAERLLLSVGDIDELARWRRSAENRALLLPGAFDRSETLIQQLALAFARSESRALAVPYMRAEPS